MFDRDPLLDKLITARNKLIGHLEAFKLTHEKVKVTLDQQIVETARAKTHKTDEQVREALELVDRFVRDTTFDCP